MSASSSTRCSQLECAVNPKTEIEQADKVISWPVSVIVPAPNILRSRCCRKTFVFGHELIPISEPTARNERYFSPELNAQTPRTGAGMATNNPGMRARNAWNFPYMAAASNACWPTPSHTVYVVYAVW